MKPQNLCPHCNHPSWLKSSRQVTPTYRTIYFQCRNVECGHTYAAELVITHTLSPSATPNPQIKLPIGALGRRGPIPATLPVPANDPAPLVAANDVAQPAAQA